MKRKQVALAITSLILFIMTGILSCRTTGSGTKETVTSLLVSNPDGSGIPLEVNFTKGKSYNHPTFAVWLENNDGYFLRTLFVTRSFGTGTFRYGDAAGGEWKSGQIRRPAALPYWEHKAGAAQGKIIYLPDAEHPVPDALTGATPKGSFILKTRGDKENPARVRLLLEINQTWDWNAYWTNDKFPGDREYMTSCQPALVYAAEIDLTKEGAVYDLLPVGRSSHSGADGNLYQDLETLTTALEIAGKITVMVGGNQ